jgi:hypothetical protein
MILTEIVQKMEIYSSLRRVSAPQDIERAMARPPASEYQSVRHIVDKVQQPPNLTTSALQQTGVGHVHEELGYRAWPTSMVEQVHYAPAHANPGTVHDLSASPRTSTSEGTAEIVRGRDGNFGSSTSPGDPMVDVDWVRYFHVFHARS